MSIRAAYIFKDAETEVAVYKHSLGDPESAKGHIAGALEYAWPLPRFEAADFAAAFVAANKSKHGGEVQLLPGLWDSFPADLAYVYEITFSAGKVRVKGWSVSYNDDAPLRSLRWSWTEVKGWTMTGKKLEASRNG